MLLQGNKALLKHNFVVNKLFFEYKRLGKALREKGEDLV